MIPSSWLFSSPSIQVSKAHVHTRHFQDSVVSQIFELSLDYFSLLSYKPAYVELVQPFLRQLQAISSDSKLSNFRSALKQLQEKLKANIAFVLQNRDQLANAPNDLEAVQEWEVRLTAAGQSPLSIFRSQWIGMEEKRRTLLSIQDINVNDDSDDDSKPEKKKKGSNFQDDSDDVDASDADVSDIDLSDYVQEFDDDESDYKSSKPKAKSKPNPRDKLPTKPMLVKPATAAKSASVVSEPQLKNAKSAKKSKFDKRKAQAQPREVMYVSNFYILS